MKKSKKAYKWEILMHKIYKNLIRIFTTHKATDIFSETLIKISMQFLIIFQQFCSLYRTTIQPCLAKVIIS